MTGVLEGMKPIGWYMPGVGFHFMPGMSEADLPPGYTFEPFKEESDDSVPN